MNDMVKRNFDFNGSEFVVITDGNNDPWFIATDIAKALGYDKPNNAISTHCKKANKINCPELGYVIPINVIPESDVYRLIMRSRLPSAEAFQDWIMEEVIPSIRKTGSFSPKSTSKMELGKIRSEYNEAIELAKIFGLDGNQAKLAANKVMRNYYGYDPMHMLEITHLESEQKEIHLTPTDIGKQLGITGQKANKLLESAGLQEGVRGRKNKLIWNPTSEGKNHCVMKDTGKRHSDGTPVVQVFWTGGVIEMIKDGITA